MRYRDWRRSDQSRPAFVLDRQRALPGKRLPGDAYRTALVSFRISGLPAASAGSSARSSAATSAVARSQCSRCLPCGRPSSSQIACARSRIRASRSSCIVISITAHLNAEMKPSDPSKHCETGPAGSSPGPTQVSPRPAGRPPGSCEWLVSLRRSCGRRGVRPCGSGPWRLRPASPCRRNNPARCRSRGRASG